MATKMRVKRVAKAGISRPFGDDREVTQAFPSAAPPEESDPFLMCDHWDAGDMDSKAVDDDDFPIGWHPHRGFDIATYLRIGTGRHADSLGNRGTFASPGMQWMSTGSGVYHAEGGANEAGARFQGFQIWINVPRDNKMDPPRYGTTQPDTLPVVDLGSGATARVLAGRLDGMNSRAFHDGPAGADDRLRPAGGSDRVLRRDGGLRDRHAYVHMGSLDALNGSPAGIQGVVLMDATDDGRRTVEMTAGADGAAVMLFAGKQLDQPIKWHGPIVMANNYDLYNTFNELRRNVFPPVCVPWDYRRCAARPAD